MPNLKTERGTVLYAQVVFDGPTGNGQTLTLPVFNAQIAAIKLTTFLMEGSGEVPFGGISPEMNEGTARSCALVVSYPDGSSATTATITFGTTVVVGWSDALIAAFGPPTDPDWHNNPAYITMDQHFMVSASGAHTKPKKPATAAATTSSRPTAAKKATKKSAKKAARKAAG